MSRHKYLAIRRQPEQQQKTGTLPALLCAAALAAAPAHAQTNHYVWTGGGNASPYTNWATAAHTIQAAIDASAAGAVIWVTNGTYNTGGSANYPAGATLTNRVVIDRAITIRSVNGPSNTVIAGRWHVPGDTNNIFGDAAVRCVYMAAGSVLIGFTITNGATRNLLSDDNNGSGAGVWCPADNNGMVSNCFITGNAAKWNGGGSYRCGSYSCAISGNKGYYGGGAYRGTHYNSDISRNTSVNGGGAYQGAWYRCAMSGNTAEFGGGATYATLYNCSVSGNRALQQGGGIRDCTIYNSLIQSNRAQFAGGGAIFDSGSSRTLYNCTVANNTVSSAGMSGGGMYLGNAVNSIVFHNTAPDASRSNYWGVYSFTNSCTAPLPAGPSNLDVNPMFRGLDSDDFRLALGSPCVNTGMNFSWMGDTEDPHGRNKDLDAEPRLRGQVDMGAYEQYITPGTIFIIRGQ